MINIHKFILTFDRKYIQLDFAQSGKQYEYVCLLLSIKLFYIVQVLFW